MKNHRSVTVILDRLDLTVPADLFLAFERFRHWPDAGYWNEEVYCRQNHVLDFFAPLIFGELDSPESAGIVHRFLWELGGSIPGDTPDSERPCAPREWLCVFREAFQRGDIGPVAFGAAFRFFLIQTGGNGAPGFAPDSLDARRLMLSDARQASPLGLMRDDEPQVFARRPDTIKVASF